MQSEALTRSVDTREELIEALQEASALEHSVLVQYLFAGYSFKKRPAEGLSDAQLEMVRGWQRSVLSVARQEMAHLGTVCNLLAAIGGVPRFEAPGSHEANVRRYPFKHQLERFNPATLQRFIRIEAPADSDAAQAPAAGTGGGTVGRFYDEIAVALRRLDRRTGELVNPLFVNPEAGQGDGRWTMAVGPGSFDVVPVRNLVSALAAINLITVEGEGTSETVERSHYAAFRQVHREYSDELARCSDFDPARRVVDSPVTRAPAKADPAGYTVLPPGTPAHRLAELFNRIYGTLLLMLTRYYETRRLHQRQLDLQACIRECMTAVMRPLAEVLTELPAGGGIVGNAGPPFEAPPDLSLPERRADSAAMVRAELEQASEECCRLADEGAPLSRLVFVSTSLKLLADQVGRVATGAA